VDVSINSYATLYRGNLETTDTVLHFPDSVTTRRRGRPSTAQPKTPDMSVPDDLEKGTQKEMEFNKEAGGLQVSVGQEDNEDALSALTLAGPSGNGSFDLETYLRKVMQQ
jgi:hypothetical protein